MSLSGSLARKCMSLNSQPSMTRPTINDLNPDELNQGLSHYLFMVRLDKCNGSFNTTDDPSSKICYHINNILPY